MLILGLTSTEQSAAETDTLLEQSILELPAKGAAALTELYHKTSSSVYGFALSILKNPQDAEDVLHDCYLSIFTAAAGYQPKGKPMAWILTITRNLCLLKLRQRRKTADLAPEDWETALVGREGLSQEERLLLTQCMTQLSDQEREIVTLHAVAGLKHREIAGMMDLALPTVLSKYSRALKKLKEFWVKGE